MCFGQYSNVSMDLYGTFLEVEEISNENTLMVRLERGS